MDGNYLSRFITNKTVSRAKIELKRDSKSYLSILGVSEGLLKKIGLTGKTKKLTFDSYYKSLLPIDAPNKYTIAPNLARPNHEVFTKKRKTKKARANKREKLISEESFKSIKYNNFLKLNKNWLKYHNKATKQGSANLDTLDLHFCIMKQISTNLNPNNSEENNEFIVLEETRKCLIGINKKNEKVVFKKKNNIFMITLKDDVLLFFGNNELRKAETRSFKKFKDKNTRPILDELYKFRST
eukprot:GAHX01002318.1.p1 GENE.GAHX01002318.1~~GAHX01002318.1.p1  ORF type:complete len:241 (-),score=52.12 GAHX01002318.1:42-764(-)